MPSWIYTICQQNRQTTVFISLHRSRYSLPDILSPQRRAQRCMTFSISQCTSRDRVSHVPGHSGIQVYRNLHGYRPRWTLLRSSRPPWLIIVLRQVSQGSIISASMLIIGYSSSKYRSFRCQRVRALNRVHAPECETDLPFTREPFLLPVFPALPRLKRSVHSPLSFDISSFSRYSRVSYHINDFSFAFSSHSS